MACLLVANWHAHLVTIQDEMITKVCISMLRINVQSLGYKSCIAVKKPFLKNAHKAQKLAFAQANAHWSVDNWKNVIWIDESSFEVGKNLLLIQVWWQVYKRYSWDCLCPTFKRGCVSIMV